MRSIVKAPIVECTLFLAFLTLWAEECFSLTTTKSRIPQELHLPSIKPTPSQPAAMHAHSVASAPESESFDSKNLNKGPISTSKAHTRRLTTTSDANFASALGALYSCGGSNDRWEHSRNWELSQENPCGDLGDTTTAWYGIYCDTSVLRTPLQNVVKINLAGNGLTNSLPTEIGFFSRLVSSLIMAENTLTQVIPSELGHLVNITKSIDLSENDFIGTIPTQLGHLTSLTAELDFRFNMLSGPIPTQIGTLTLLSNGFIVGSNHLSGSIPTQIGLLRFLTERLELYSNSLTGDLPTELGHLSRLTRNMRLHSNNLGFNSTGWNPSGIPTEFGKLSSLTAYLRLESNHLLGEIPTQLGNLSTELQYLDVSHNNLCGDFPIQLYKLVSSSTNDFGYIAVGSGESSNSLGTPCISPSSFPTSLPTFLPSAEPTITPTNMPTRYSAIPSLLPSKVPTSTPTGGNSFRALMYLYESTGGGSDWLKKTSWMDGLPCTSSWYGISCAQGTSDVTRVHLEDNSLFGTLPT